eukprot:PhF_6_TR585/c0_g2_i1/m.640
MRCGGCHVGRHYRGGNIFRCRCFQQPHVPNSTCGWYDCETNLHRGSNVYNHGLRYHVDIQQHYTLSADRTQQPDAVQYPKLVDYESRSRSGRQSQRGFPKTNCC